MISIGSNVFNGCNIEKLYYDCIIDPNIISDSLSELYIGDNVSIVFDFFKDLKLNKIVLGKNVKEIRVEAFSNSQIKELSITCEEPPYLYPNIFGKQDLSKSTLYVPENKTEYYQTTEPWSNFGKILTLIGEKPSVPEKCATPSISYIDGTLKFRSETDGVKYSSSIVIDDCKFFYTEDIVLSGCYDISVIATKEGLLNSDVATAKLYWLSSSGSIGTDLISTAKTRGVVIQSAAGFITISGLDSSEQVDFFSTDGKALGSAKAMGGTATFAAQSGSVVVAKIGKESVKIAVK